MSKTHNPIMKRMLPDEVLKRQAEVDQKFDEIVSSQKMTVGGTSIKALGLFGLLLVGATLGWRFTAAQESIDVVFNLQWGLIFVTLGLAMWASYGKKVNKFAVLIYAVVEGFLIGMMSMLYEFMYPGIVMNAVIGTLSTAGIMFLAYSRGWIKVTSGYRKVMVTAMFGYLGFAVINLIVGFFTHSAGVYSTPMAWVFGLVGVGLAAFTLNLDFDDISQGAAQGLPREYEWRAAFGLLVTMVWLYLEILRLLAILRRD